MSERDLIYQHMEAILVKLGLEDMNCERWRMLAAEEENPVKKAGLTQMAEISATRLSMVATEAIELGRALAARAKKAAEVPKEIPESLKNEESAYQGAEGVPQDPRIESTAFTGTPGDSSKAN